MVMLQLFALAALFIRLPVANAKKDCDAACIAHELSLAQGRGVDYLEKKRVDAMIGTMSLKANMMLQTGSKSRKKTPGSGLSEDGMQVFKAAGMQPPPNSAGGKKPFNPFMPDPALSGK
mmetsp:Transcript_115602/g.230447  ORF Transcript_115602/g.230447 Transcript_115602/m.230447 type:complete len:119 (-) Transcript_115602:81-437(-)|eukprot:CAMPEP_0172708486 /NCGR_PEP_ID=MMETSP1074-20121228/51134_1 /TAXON_ID=2916 /ORGANISM="Ceratium fusus, Strain PA161109" /LENGTH=118 /DNA_ID=CAMNT_0013531469 /DNA_START=51 /DNA_END=407 /DNA_ORIENTATION=+